jgi:hypothetical protein
VYIRASAISIRTLFFAVGFLEYAATADSNRFCSGETLASLIGFPYV